MLTINQVGNSNLFLNKLNEKLRVNTDRDLCELMGRHRSIVSKMRNGHPSTTSFLFEVMVLTGWSIQEVENLLGYKFNSFIN